MSTLVFLAALIPCLVSSRLAEAHIRLTSPTARYVQDDNGLKTGPCGSGTATGTITPIVPGQTLTVTWKESVSHAGHYRIALSANASDFSEPTSLAIPATLPSWDLADGIQDKTGTQTYSQTVQIPNTECPACVLQLLQIMSAGTDGTNSGTFSGVYHACADVKISASNGDAGTAQDGAMIVDMRLDVGLRDSPDGNGVHMDTAAGGATGTGGDGSGGTGIGGSMSGAGGAIGSGGSSTSGSSLAAGGTTSKGTGGSGGTAGANGGTFGGATAGNSGGAGGLGGGGSNGGSAGHVASTGGSSGSGGAASGGSAGSSAGSGGRGGTSETSPASSPSGCSCQLGSHSASGVVTLLSLLVCCLGLVRRSRRSGAS